MTIKTFRGILADDAQDTIRLSTKQGKIGYRIIKFNAMPVNPNTNTETTMAIYKTTQTTSPASSDISANVDFSDQNLLAALFYTTSESQLYSPLPLIIFDREIFNQDIYITLKGSSYTNSMNYYIELEVMNLNDNEASVATLMDIRGS